MTLNYPNSPLRGERCVLLFRSVDGYALYLGSFFLGVVRTLDDLRRKAF